MDFLTTVYLLMFQLCLVLSFERLIGVFFEKRRTSLIVTIGSYLLLFFFFVLEVLLMSAFFGTIAVLSYLIIPLNYESSMLKRFIFAVCSYLCIQMIQGTFIFATGIMQNAVLYPNSNTALLFLASGVFTYVITSLFRRFKYIKTSTMALPTSWISFLIIPSFSIAIIVMMFLF